MIYNFNVVLAVYHRDVYERLHHRMKIIHYTIDKPFHGIKSNKLPRNEFIHFWTLWHQIRDEMLNRSLTSQIF